MRDMEDYGVKYAGFWIRFAAYIFDGIILFIAIGAIEMIMALLLPDTVASSNGTFNPEESLAKVGIGMIILSLFIFLAPVIFIIFMWTKYSATPGKMILGLEVVDKDTGEPLTIGKSIIRLIGYIISSIPFSLGYIWAGFDKKKQAWHDKLANSVVLQKVRN